MIATLQPRKANQLKSAESSVPLALCNGIVAECRPRQRGVPCRHGFIPVCH